jgi:hypothetical protein
LPSIDPAGRAALLGRSMLPPCQRCDAVLWRHYCRSCDTFFYSCACETTGETDQWRDHLGHRVYLWTPSGIRAIPDFDSLR